MVGNVLPGIILSGNPIKYHQMKRFCLRSLYFLFSLPNVLALVYVSPLPCLGDAQKVNMCSDSSSLE